MNVRKNGSDIFGRSVFPDYTIEETEDFYVGEAGRVWKDRDENRNFRACRGSNREPRVSVFPLSLSQN